MYHLRYGTTFTEPFQNSASPENISTPFEIITPTDGSSQTITATFIAGMLISFSWLTKHKNKQL